MSVVLVVLLVVAGWAVWSRIGSLERKLERLEKSLHDRQRIGAGTDADAGSAQTPARAELADAVAALREARAAEPPAQPGAWTPAPVPASGLPRSPSIGEAL